MSKTHDTIVIGRRYRHVSGKVVRVCAVPLLVGNNEEYVVYQEESKAHTVFTQPLLSFLAPSTPLSSRRNLYPSKEDKP